MAKLDDLLRRCTVRVMVPGGGHGSGAFVAPGLVLTCAHVVEPAREARAGVELRWAGQPLAATIAEYHSKPFPDLALLRVEHTDHPCVWLDDRIDLGDPLYAFGYTDQEPDGDSATLEYEGPTTRGADALHKLKDGQVRPGLSGGPLLNRRTGAVCGVVKATRDRSTDLGGRAVPVGAVFAALAGLQDLQRRFHALDPAWLDALDATQRDGLQPSAATLVNPFFGKSTELFGREEALERVFEKLRRGNHCSVVGPVGSGKSALLKAVEVGVPDRLAIPADRMLRINFRSVTGLPDLQETIVSHLGGRRLNQWRGLMHAKPLRLLVLDHLGGMDPGVRGLTMRRWLLGLDDFGTRLLLASNEHLDVLFRGDDPTRDSPLAGLDPIPVRLAPLGAADCERLVARRLARCGLCIDSFADLWREPQQPGALLGRCAERFETLRPDRKGRRS